MQLSLIVALDSHGLIGRENGLPWRLPADLKHFKQHTMGKPLLMGRKTCMSLPKPLPGRRNLVLTRNPVFSRDGFEIYHQVEDALRAVQANDECMVIGGSELYRALWPQISRAYVTLVEGAFSGDTWFPEWPLGPEWRLVESVPRLADGENAHDLTFLVYERVEKN